MSRARTERDRKARRRRVALGAIAAGMCIALSSCEPSARDLSWEFVVRDADRAARAVAFEARVLEGGCTESNAVRWSARWRDGESATAPPVLGEGTYGLVTIALDEQCRPVAAACRPVDLPRASEGVVQLELLPADGMPCGGCDRGLCPESAPPGAFTVCEATRESDVSCSDGRDDDCDRSADCGDDDCATTSACSCEGGCGTCERCVSGRCIPVDDRVACTTAAGEGRCVRGACCNGCSLDDVCAPGTSPGLCGAPGGECVACGCPAIDLCETGACVELGGAVEVAAGADYGCAREATGRMQCWGDGGSGRLGTDSTETSALPAIVRCTNGSPMCVDWRAPSLGRVHGCAIRPSDGRDRPACWGGNEHLQLGRGLTSGSPTPQLVGGAFGAMGSQLAGLDVAAGDDFTCAVARDGAVSAPEGRLYCWGRFDEGRIGVALTADRGTPLSVPVTGDPDLVAVSLGRAHGCALAIDGALYCWGANDHGQVGIASSAPVVETPQRVNGTFAAVFAGGDHTCARRLTTSPMRERVECWGRNDAGQLGIGDRSDRDRPVPLAEFPNGAYPMALGAAHTCVLDTMGRLSCFGDDSRGQVGAPSGADTSLPTMVFPGQRFVSVAAGGDHSCAVGSRGELVCWGDNATGESGALPVGGTTARSRVCL